MATRTTIFVFIKSEVPALAKVNDFLTVLYEPNDPDPKRRYKCVYIAHPSFDDGTGRTQWYWSE